MSKTTSDLLATLNEQRKAYWKLHTEVGNTHYSSTTEQEDDIVRLSKLGLAVRATALALKAACEV